jgi:hypothetical protein
VTFNRRIAGIAAGTAAAIVLITWYVMSWVTSFPPTVMAGTTGGVTNVTFQTVASFGHQPHPDWVSYLVKNPQGDWVHSTVVQVPAHSLVRFTIYNYDGASGLRNPLWSQPRGTVGGTETINGKPYASIDPTLASQSPTWASAWRSRESLTTRRTSARSHPASYRWPTRPSLSRSAPVSPATTAGSASSPAPPGSPTASAVPCKRWVGWTAT